MVEERERECKKDRRESSETGKSKSSARESRRRKVGVYVCGACVWGGMQLKLMHDGRFFLCAHQNLENGRERGRVGQRTFVRTGGCVCVGCVCVEGVWGGDVCVFVSSHTK